MILDQTRVIIDWLDLVTAVRDYWYSFSTSHFFCSSAGFVLCLSYFSIIYWRFKAFSWFCSSPRWSCFLYSHGMVTLLFSLPPQFPIFNSFFVLFFLKYGRTSKLWNWFSKIFNEFFNHRNNFFKSCPRTSHSFSLFPSLFILSLIPNKQLTLLIYCSFFDRKLLLLIKYLPLHKLIHFHINNKHNITININNRAPLLLILSLQEYLSLQDGNKE